METQTVEAADKHPAQNFVWPVIPGTVVRIDGQWMQARAIIGPSSYHAIPDGCHGIVAFAPVQAPEGEPRTTHVIEMFES